MILVCIGLPGRFAEWCDAVIARLADRAGGVVGIRVCPTLEEMVGYRPIASTIDEAALALLKGELSHLVIGARQPDLQLRAALVQTNARFVIALDDPRIAVYELLNRTGNDLSTVTRAIANCCPLVMTYLSLEGALTLRADREGVDPGAAVATIADHLGIAADAAEIRQIIDDLANRDINPKNQRTSPGRITSPRQAGKRLTVRLKVMLSGSPGEVWGQSFGPATYSC